MAKKTINQALKDLFLGLGGDSSALADNSSCSDYIEDLESAIKGAASGAQIDDTAPSETKVYSSSKVESLIPSIPDDEKVVIFEIKKDPNSLAYVLQGGKKFTNVYSEFQAGNFPVLYNSTTGAYLLPALILSDKFIFTNTRVEESQVLFVNAVTTLQDTERIPFTQYVLSVTT